MGYWKREYTERKGGKPLFKLEPKEPKAEGQIEGEDAVDHPPSAAGAQAPTPPRALDSP
ncbi:MAG: hypothetical protein H0V43_03645 [Gemmatimonadales bacterium]|nr:hypothetical protein [Gemmatimonadales bacterium]